MGPWCLQKDISTAWKKHLARPRVLQPIANYFEDTYIGRRGRRHRWAPLFAISMWNMHSRVNDGLPRTNNSVESWHNAFQVSLQCSHPSIWTLLDALLKENALQQTVVNQTIWGTQPLKKKKRYEKINNALNTLFEKREETPKLDFLRGCSYNLKLNV